MRLLIVSRLHLSYGGGGENWIQEVARRASKDAEVTVLTSTLGLGRFETEFDQLGSPVAYRTFRTLGATTLPNLAGQQELRAAVSRADVVYFSYTPGGLEVTMALLERLLDTPVIAGHHGVIRWPTFQRVDDGKTRAMFSLFGPRNVRLARGFAAHHVQNQSDGAELRRWGISRIHNIPAAVDCTSYPAKPLAEKFTILFLGTITYQKGVDLLYPLARKLDHLLPAYRLVVAGSGEDRASIESLTQLPRTEVVGFVNEQEKRNLLASAHVFVLPSRFESFGLAALESIASGTPVVGFNIPGPDSYLRNGVNGYLVTDLDEMAEKIAEVHEMWLSEKERYTGMRVAARAISARFDWSVVFPRLWDMFESVSGRSGETGVNREGAAQRAQS
jgi:glycosyltransferase involved in cell wall biosynthesis